MKLNEIDKNELYPTEKVGPSVLGTIIYKVGEQSQFKGAYITTNERVIMSVDMNGEPYKRVFSYQDIKAVTIEDKGVLFIEFPQGKVAMIDIEEGDKVAFKDYVNNLVQQ
ncbi:hypothetical protein [Mammaliicoccus sciuri]|uniref:hypothetical protein n=1 Tax=Mammaliicoccus sciuri TaxID=1296 RepID=UPI000E68A5C9|nr:hypothetical protein [Mammaliicoccus sciuri]RIO16299.1 hypothetical protein BUZ93_01140 [Mammaliicoccus sciuri]RIO21341.1 hypothetical protein BUZ92_02090 [Mammaliicoccus sciuri]